MMPHLLGVGSIDPDPAASHDDDLIQDLELDILLDAMAGAGVRERTVARAVLLQPLTSAAAIVRRREAIEDARHHHDAVLALDEIALRAVDRERNDPLWMLNLHPTPTQQLSHDIRRLGRLLPLLDEVRRWCAAGGTALSSSAFTEFRDAFLAALDEASIERLRTVHAQLSFPDGVIVSAGLDRVGQVGAAHLRRADPGNRRLFGGPPLVRPTHTYRVPERDQAGFDALAALTDRSVDHVGELIHRAVETLERFFVALHDEIGFLVCCERLHGELESRGVALTRPTPLTDRPERFDADSVSVGFHARGLVDPCLALRSGTAPVGNDVDVDVHEVLVITGANHGGKSTLLRAIGLAQLMMQAGLPVAAEACSAAVVERVHTHWPREEDEGFVRGKLDDELARMSAIVDRVAPGDLVLSNESFSSTNEHEGAQIASEVVHGLTGAGVRVAIVTHLFDLAATIADDPTLPAVFLRAARGEAGDRSFHLDPGPPQRTSYGMDVFDAVFGTDLAGHSTSPDSREKSA